MDKINKVCVNNIEYIIKNKKDIIEKTLFEGNQWNNDVLLLLGHFIKKHNLKHLLNVGSHIGTLALPVSKYLEKVTAIESFPPTYKHFLENLKLNNIKNIVPYNIALGDKENKVYFLDNKHERIKNNSGGIHTLTEDDIKGNRLSANLHSKKIKNSMKKLDDLPIERFDIMLIDIEGNELEMIIGGLNKINENKPIIIIEIWDDPKRRSENLVSSKEDVISYIKNLDYAFIKKINDNYIFFPNNLKT